MLSLFRIIYNLIIHISMNILMLYRLFNLFNISTHFKIVLYFLIISLLFSHFILFIFYFTPISTLMSFILLLLLFSLIFSYLNLLWPLFMLFIFISNINICTDWAKYNTINYSWKMWLNIRIMCMRLWSK
jgi:hypothetical protein